MLERVFGLKENRTAPATEIMAGVATFLTAVYILMVNPSILSQTGMPEKALFTATALSIIVGTLLMAFLANMPFILAPGMGINVYFAFSIVKAQGYSWQEALTAVLIAGLLFVLTGLCGLRTILLRDFPEALKHSITVAIGMMIAFIGLANSKVMIVGDGFIRLADITTGSPRLVVIGILATGAFLAWGVRAAVLLGIIVATIVGVATGVVDHQAALAEGIVSLPPSIAPIAMAFTFDWARLLTPNFAMLVFTLLVLDVFDSLGTFIGVFNQFQGEERMRYESRIPAALMADALATVGGACLGVSTVTTYVESSTGVAAGGRTGLTGVTIAVLMGVALFASPLFLMVPPAAVAPALIIVGMYMMAMSAKIHFLAVSEGLPALINILVTALTWSISDGLMYGWLSYIVFKIFAGKARELNPTVVVVGLCFLARVVLQ